jgi:hypothetical protein
MTNTRQDAFYLMLLGSILFALIGFATACLNYFGMDDFKLFYCASRCLIQHHDPYQASDLRAVYQAEGMELPSDPRVAGWHNTEPSTDNFPTTFLLVAPIAVLPWKLAEAIWMLLTAGCFIAAAFAMWNLGAESAPRIYSLLIFLFLINSELLLSIGNNAGIVVGLCVIAVCSFLRERFVLAGILCLAVSLAMKPHDAGLIWIYFLLAGGVVRKRALETLAVVALLAVPAMLWMSHVAPHWPQELHSNIAMKMSRGGIDDPGPHSGGAFGVNMIISLQAIISRFRDDSGFYNPIAYLIVAALLVPWLIKTLRSRFSPELAWFALAAVVPLAMLPVYHRCYDARLLMLTIPAFAMLWKKGGLAAWCALLLTLAAIVITGDIFWIAVFHFTHYSYSSALQGMIPAPLILLGLGIFYLWAYLRRDAASALVAAAADL